MGNSLKIFFLVLFIAVGSVATAQVDNRTSREPGNTSDSIRRFKIEDGLYVGAHMDKNRKQPSAKNAIRQMKPNNHSLDSAKTRRFVLEDGADVGSGATYRAEWAKSFLAAKKPVFNN